MFRFSLRTLAAAVTTIGLACAALINASPTIASLMWTVTVLGLALATVAAAVGTPRGRGFWTGFAIVGWALLFITVSPLFGDLQSSLFTTALVQYAARAMPQAGNVPSTTAPQIAYAPTTNYVVAPAPVVATPKYDSLTYDALTMSMPIYNPPAPTPWPVTTTVPVTTYAGTAVTWTPATSQFTESFVHIGEALWVLVLALAGGLLGQYLVARNAALARAAASPALP